MEKYNNNEQKSSMQYQRIEALQYFQASITHHATKVNQNPFNQTNSQFEEAHEKDTQRHTSIR